MGIFNKNRDIRTSATSAADIFAEKNKLPAEKTGDGVEDRILGYSTLKGAEVVTPKSAPIDRIAELRRIREMGKDSTDYEKSEITRLDAESKTAAGDAINARKNLINSANISMKDQKNLSAGERAAIEAKGMATLDDIVSGIKNKQFLTEVDDELGGEIIEKKNKTAVKSADTNLSSDEILSKTAAIRNSGFFTETEVDIEHKPISAEKKLQQDLDELESAENAINSFTNVGFRRQSTVSEVLDDTDSDLNEEGGK